MVNLANFETDFDRSSQYLDHAVSTKPSESDKDINNETSPPYPTSQITTGTSILVITNHLHRDGRHIVNMNIP